MARGIPGVVKVQENTGAGTMFVTLPKNIREDLDPNAQELILFYKQPGQRDWALRKITHGEKEQIKDAHQQGLISQISKALKSFLLG